jgi:hypothetical protein
MRKLRIFEHISLDGVIQQSADENDFPYSDWSAPYRTPTGRDTLLALYGGSFDLLIGANPRSLTKCDQNLLGASKVRWRSKTPLDSIKPKGERSAAGSLFAAAALLALSALLACLLPAGHAIAVPPAEALRYGIERALFAYEIMIGMRRTFWGVS